MLSFKDRTDALDFEQSENKVGHLKDMLHHLNGIEASIKEIQIDLFHFLRHLQEVQESLHGIST